MAKPLTIDVIRVFLRDTVDHNNLTDAIEFPDKDIETGIDLAVAKWNAITPMSNITNPADINAYILLCGVCGILLKSEGLRQNRNQLTVQDGNIAPIGIDDKQQQYMQWAAHFQNEFHTLAKQNKIQQNMESIIGPSSGFGSGYSWTNTRYTY
jgi:hypothetical protein